MKNVKEILPGVAMIVFDDAHRILLQKRKDVKLWGIPSGHVEPLETVKDAAVREVLEETGLKIEIIKLIGIYSDPKSQVFEYPDGTITHFITTCFEGKITGGKLCCNDEESLDVQFFSLDQLPSDMLCMHPTWLKDALEDRGPYIR